MSKDHRYLASNDNRRCHMYAIIATGGKQYKVAEGDVITSRETWR